jgi:hypothetical protein
MVIGFPLQRSTSVVRASPQPRFSRMLFWDSVFERMLPNLSGGGIVAVHRLFLLLLTLVPMRAFAADAPANQSMHPAATQHLPIFITAPGQTDVLMVVMAFVLVGVVVGFGVLFLRLHTLPERVAHRGHKIQFEIVAILGLIALFTHMHIFWVIGLLLAFIDIPDFGGFLGRIAGSVERIAGVKPGAGAEGVPNLGRPEQTEHHTDDISSPSRKPARAMTGKKELDHA